MSSHLRVGEGRRRRLIVVSGYGNNAMTPRGQRTLRLVDELERGWNVDLIAMQDKLSSAPPGGSTSRRAAIRRLAGNMVYKALLDRWELWALRRLGRWHPDADAVLLIAAPWSPVVYASRRLARAGIPYVVDVGDTWVLTADLKVSAAPNWRARRAERFLWDHAVGAVVTTRAQGERLSDRFPDLPIMVRPNGYKPVSRLLEPPKREARSDSCLRLAHFGVLSANRIDLIPFLAELQRSGRWKSIVFAQFGNDFGAGLERAPEGVSIEHHAPRPWHEVVELAPEFDAAVVVASPPIGLLPSKAVEYSTLPIPRIAFTNPDPADALREYVEPHTSWLVLANGEPDIGRRVWEHIDRPWSAEELAPSADNAWPAVAAQVAEFVATCTNGESAGRLIDKAPLSA